MARDRSVSYGTETMQANTIVASARSLQGASISAPKQSKTIKSQAWMDRAWESYDIIGEYHYAVNWVGNILSRAKLVVTKNGKLQKSGPAFDLMKQFFGGPTGQTEMLRQTGIHFTVAGDCYYVGESNSDGTDSWRVVAASEMTGSSQAGFKAEKIPIPKDALVIRQWKKHPRKSEESDCPTRAVLTILSELYGLTQHVAAQIDSRLAGAGLLAVPSEMTLGVGPATTEANGTDTGPGPSTGADGLMETLRLAMVTAIGNREDASAVVPIIIQAPGEFLDKIQHITFWTQLDSVAQELRKEAIGRLGLGMDMPPEVLQGTADMNHWSSWQVEEAAIKAHTEPLLDVITQGITTHYLQAALRQSGVPDWDQYVVDVDTSEMRLRPNRSKEALELFNIGELSPEALLRENGFSEEDAMSDKERNTWLLIKLAQGSPSPELVALALSKLGIEIPQAAIEAAIKPSEPVNLPTSTAEHPVRDIPDETDATAAALEASVFRALERVGNRIKNTKGFTAPAGVEPIDIYQVVPVPLADFDQLLDGAWGLCERMNILPTVVQQLDTYTRALLATRKPHDRELMLSYMKVTR